MSYVIWESKLLSVFRSSMHTYPGNWVAIGVATVCCARAAHAFSAVIECRHCSPMEIKPCTFTLTKTYPDFLVYILLFLNCSLWFHMSRFCYHITVNKNTSIHTDLLIRRNTILLLHNWLRENWYCRSFIHSDYTWQYSVIRKMNYTASTLFKSRNSFCLLINHISISDKSYFQGLYFMHVTVYV